MHYGDIRVPASGPERARIMIVGEAPGTSEEQRLAPFVGASGNELTRMLADAGIDREQCYITNVFKYRPTGNDIANLFYKKTEANRFAISEYSGFYPDPALVSGISEVHQETETVQPNVIIALGNVALWALTGEGKGKSGHAPSGITKWRASMLETIHTERPIKVLPTYHPAAILRQYSRRQTAVQDLRRAAEAQHTPGPWPVPPYSFTIRPSYTDTIETLEHLQQTLDRVESPVPLAVDLETRSKHIACCGIAWSRTEVICIPFMCTERTEGYWEPGQELEIIERLRSVLCHPRAYIIGQNFNYDLQYFVRCQLFNPGCDFDTMLAQHLAFPGTPKGLDYLSSLYCQYHRYWKDEGKAWEPGIDEEQLWTYNCKDACTTFEVHATLEHILAQFKLTDQYYSFMLPLASVMLDVMLRGIRVDRRLKQQFASETLDMQADAARRLEYFIPEPYIGVKKPTKQTAVWYDSPTQTATLLYSQFGLKPIQHRKTKQPTTEDSALKQIEEKHPIFYPMLSTLRFYRSLGVFQSNFLATKLSSDGRLRCSYNTAGTETFRFSSSTDAFGEGTNLQNIPNNERRASDPILSALPDIRRMLKPDPGQIIMEFDLDRADAQVVAWEADDAELKQIFREGLDLHRENASAIWNIAPEKVTDSQRYLAKAGVHATNYGSYPKTLAATLGITMKEAERFRTRWLEAHPAIAAWHRRIEHQIQTTRKVVNAFGFHRIYFDRVDNLLREALAWIPQSSVALTIDYGILNIARNLPEVEILLQVHDSVVVQCPTSRAPDLIPQILSNLRVPIPYPDPLIIPVSGKWSTESWAEAKKIEMDTWHNVSG